MYPATNLVIIPLLIAEDERRREHKRGVPNRAKSVAHRISPFKRLVWQVLPKRALSTASPLGANR
jgi:hypothetical protein